MRGRRLPLTTVHALRSSRRSCWLLGGAIAASLAAPAAAPAAAQEVRPLKAAIVFNLIQFVQWPAAPASGAPLVLCAARTSPILKELAALEAGARGPYPLRVQGLDAAEPPAECNVWFADAKPAAAAVPATAGRPLLVIADTDHAGEAGVVIHLRQAGERIAFDVNLAAARRNGLQISSRLLRLATKVQE